jgi:glycerol-3-phosphate dehydrogenase
VEKRLLEVKLSSPLLDAENHYPVLIVGGGIVGAGIFRDLSLHGVPSLLIEKKDFSSQTSQSSSKMLHGGIRYLENLDFALVFEALHEKNLWLKLAPHLCYEQPFYMPVYKDALRPLWMVKCGLFLYDFLSSFQNSPHQTNNKEKTLRDIKYLRENGLTGSGVYYDAIVDDAKLTLEVIYDALSNKTSQALNHVGLESVEIEGDIYKCHLKDGLTGDMRMISTDNLVFATGPFTDQLMSKLDIVNWSPKLLPSKGSHLWLSKESLPIKYPVVLTPKDGRVIFVVPQSGKVLVGTTEVQPEEDFFDIKCSRLETEYLLHNINEYFPEAKIKEKDILSTFAGIRPLVKDDNGDKGKTAREHKLYQPRSNLYLMLGGKYTTFRVMASDVAREICSKVRIPYNSNKTKQPLKRPSAILPFEPSSLTKENVIKSLENELVRTFDDLLIRRMGVPSKEHWNHEVSYEQFFKELAPSLSKHLGMTSPLD